MARILLFQKSQDRQTRKSPQIYLEVNSFKNLEQRRRAIKILREATENILKSGHSPFEDNVFDNVTKTKKYNIPDAFKLVIYCTKKRNEFNPD